MILSLFKKNTATEPVFAVYNAIVAQSRQPVFYAQWGIPDTVTGRFDMISLHLVLLFRRLRSEEPKVRAFSQAVFDLFFKDMDRSLRELGVTDMGVPKKVQKMGSIFFGLLASVNDAMDGTESGAEAEGDAPDATEPDTAALAEVLARNVYEGDAHPCAPLLAAYMFAEARRLAAQPVTAITSGTIALGETA